MDLHGSLWTLPFHGGAARQITDPLLEQARPDYSPKGDFIAFQAYRGGTFHIWTVRSDGSGLKQITTGHGDDREPRISPDGARIAFSSDRAFEGSYDIWVVELATGKTTRCTSAPADEYEPAWSPDGKQVAFVSGAGINGTSIHAIDDGGKERIMVTAPPGARLNSPSWAPDGNRIAYLQFAANQSILMVSGKRVGDGDDVFPFPAAWLPGDRLLYAGNGGIHITSLETGKTSDVPFEAQFSLHRPTYRHKRFDFDSKASKEVKGIVSPALSPNGRQVVFEALNQLWLMDIGGKPRQLTHDRFYKEDPAWSPDGRRIAYSSDKAGTEDLYVMDVSTGSEQRVTTFADSAEVAAAWSPDGSMLAYQDEFGATYTIQLAFGARKQVVPALFAPSKPSWS